MVKKFSAPDVSPNLSANIRHDQHARFLETARALGCDEDEAAFDEKLKAVVGPKVKAAPAEKE